MLTTEWTRHRSLVAIATAALISAIGVVISRATLHRRRTPLCTVSTAVQTDITLRHQLHVSDPDSNPRDETRNGVAVDTKPYNDVSRASSPGNSTVDAPLSHSTSRDLTSCLKAVEAALRVDSAGERNEESRRTLAAAWCSLGAVLRPEEVVEVNGGKHSKRDCYRLAVELEPTYGAAWSSLGNTLSPGETVAIDTTASFSFSESASPIAADHHRSVLVDAASCFSKALSLNPTSGRSWHDLGLALARRRRDSDGRGSDGGDATSTPAVVIGGVRYREEDCFVHALELDSKSADTWHQLGVALSSRLHSFARSNHGSPARPAVDPRTETDSPLLDSATLGEPNLSVTVNGESLTAERCFARAISVDPSSVQSWLGLARCLKHGEFVPVEFGGSTVDSPRRALTVERIDCLGTAVELNPTLVTGWMELGAALQEEDSTTRVVSLLAGADQPQTYSSSDCYVRALHLDPDRPSIWLALADSLGRDPTKDGSCEIFGETYTATRALIQAVRCDPDSYVVWLRLARELYTTDQTITMSGLEFLPIDCMLTSLRLRPSADAWNLLGCCIVVEGLKGPLAINIGSVHSTTALDCFVRTIEAEPDSSDAWNNLGVLAGGPTNVDLLKSVSVLRAKGVAGLGAGDEVRWSNIAAFTEATRASPHNAVAWVNLGLASLLQLLHPNGASSAVPRDAPSESPANTNDSFSTETLRLIADHFGCALKADETNALAWFGLAEALSLLPIPVTTLPSMPEVPDATFCRAKVGQYGGIRRPCEIRRTSLVDKGTLLAFTGELTPAAQPPSSVQVDPNAADTAAV